MNKTTLPGMSTVIKLDGTFEGVEKLKDLVKLILYIR